MNDLELVIGIKSTVQTLEKVHKSTNMVQCTASMGMANHTRLSLYTKHPRKGNHLER